MRNWPSAPCTRPTVSKPAESVRGDKRPSVRVAGRGANPRPGRLTAVTEKVFNAGLILDQNTKVSARVSDAIALALHLGVAIHAEDSVLDTAAVAHTAIRSEGDDRTPDEVEEFRVFDEIALEYPDVETNRVYVDAAALFLVEAVGETIAPGLEEFMPNLDPRVYVPINPSSLWASRWGRWYWLGGMYDPPAAARAGLEAPPADHPARRAMELYDLARTATTAAERFDRMRDGSAREALVRAVADSRRPS